MTSSLVVVEGHGWFLRRYKRERALQFLAFIETLPQLVIESFDAIELWKVRRIVARFGDQDLTLADAHGLAIMRDRHIRMCWSTDRHLGLMGVQLAAR